MNSRIRSAPPQRAVPQKSILNRLKSVISAGKK
jgi:hypothetical protein